MVYYEFILSILVPPTAWCELQLLEPTELCEGGKPQILKAIDLSDAERRTIVLVVGE